jgi:homoaconitase/3-isopropylmalate dehydratase large subunit
MGSTITEKILANHADTDHVTPGQIVPVRVDQSYTDDLGAPISFQILERLGVE